MPQRHFGGKYYSQSGLHNDRPVQAGRGWRLRCKETAVTADYILKILLEANQEKVQSAIQAAADGLKGMKEEIDEGHPG